MEQVMKTIIDLNSELLIDRSRVRDPYLRLLLTAIGQELVKGSSWVAVDKRIALEYEPLMPMLDRHLQHAAA
jgi:hypothetical protein